MNNVNAAIFGIICLVSVNSISFAQMGPMDPAPTPTAPDTSVISLFSNAYMNVPVDTWSADWDLADVTDTTVAGDDVKLYTNLVFAGIEFTSQTINAIDMTHFHMDLWTPDTTMLPSVFRIKLVDFGADGVFGGGDDVEHELTFDANSNPPLVTGAWVAFDIPLSDFTGLVTREHLAQLIISGDLGTVWVDNIYFYTGETQPAPSAAAPTPMIPEENVISLYSNAYSNVPVDTWSADWDLADVADTNVVGDDVKLYTNLVFAGIEFTSQTVDASSMSHFHMDIWTPDPTGLPAVFKIKLVDFGADGVFGGGDDVEHELTFDENSVPPLVTGEWVSFDIPLSDFTGLVTTGHLAQMILSGDPNTVWLDNVYFYTTATGVDEISGSVPVAYALEQNYPNPFNPTTRIQFSIPEAAHVTLNVYTILGQHVATVLDKPMNAGTFSATVDGKALPSGTYVYMISAGDFVSVRKMILLK